MASELRVVGLRTLKTSTLHKWGGQTDDDTATRTANEWFPSSGLAGLSILFTLCLHRRSKIYKNWHVNTVVQSTA